MIAESEDEDEAFYDDDYFRGGRRGGRSSGYRGRDYGGCVHSCFS